MANEFQLTKIRDALKQLDPQNTEHWTDDGLPQVAAIQQLTSDPSIRRHDIQAAWPGFAKPLPEAAEVKETGLAPAEGDGGVEGVRPPLEAGGGSTIEGEYEVFESEKDYRDSYVADVKNYGEQLVAARQKIAEGKREEQAAAKKMTEAQQALDSKFPPLTVAENIKMHLASEQAQRKARVEGQGQGGMSRLDMVHRRSNSMGWRRPKRGLGPLQTGAVAPGR